MRPAAVASALVAIGIATSSAQAFAALPPPLDRLEAEPSPMQLAVKGTNGHRISFAGSRGRVTATVQGKDGFAEYTTAGRAADGVLRARFGDLGRIAVRFRPSGGLRRREPPKGCRGESAITRRGLFLGTIRFRGEAGYTRAVASRAHGSTTTSPRWRCKGDAGRPGAGAEEAVDQALEAPVLGAFAAGGQVVFAALGEAGAEGLGSGVFVAGVRERLGPVGVERFTVVFGKERSFELDAGLSAATVSPPPPFSGSAEFRRNPDGTVVWSGALAVSLPGAPGLALTGPGFSVDLAKPKTAGELFALLGQPGMPEL